jgi:hypothetical protein
MPSITHAFDSYQLFFYSGYSTPAYMQLYASGIMVGRVLFFPDSLSSVPANQYSSNVITLYWPLSQLANLVSLLREEKPLYISLNTDNGIGILATSDFEPVGEQEGV